MTTTTQTGNGKNGKTNGTGRQTVVPSVMVPVMSARPAGSLPAGAQPSVSWEVITPATAAAYLATNADHQRRLSAHIVTRYAADMRSGRWMQTHQGIAFDANGKLIDGQHRLSAIVESGASVGMIVYRNAAPESICVIDDNYTRSIQQTMKILDGVAISNFEKATGTRMFLRAGGNYATSVTKTVLRDYLRTHLADIRWVCLMFDAARAPGVRRAPVAAPVVRALVAGADRQRLKEFVSVLAGGIATKQEHRIVIILRDWLTQTAMRSNSGGSAAATVYRKAERALQAFLNGERIKTLYEATSELFPLPGESR